MQGADKMNAEIKAWANDTKDDLKKQFDLLKIEHREHSPSPVASREALTNSFGSKLGLIARIGFKFPRHMVFVQKGVGRGVPASVAGTAATKRQPKDWFNGVMEQQVDKLADIAADNQADMIVGNLLIK